MEKMTRLVDDISHQQPTLADALLKLISNFDYEPILIALNRLGGKSLRKIFPCEIWR